MTTTPPTPCEACAAGYHSACAGGGCGCPCLPAAYMAWQLREPEAAGDMAEWEEELRRGVG